MILRVNGSTSSAISSATPSLERRGLISSFASSDMLNRGHAPKIRRAVPIELSNLGDL